MQKGFPTIIVLFLLLGCGGKNIDLNSKFDSPNFTKEINSLVTNKLISTVDQKTLTDYIGLFPTDSLPVITMSYGELLKTANEYYNNLKLIEEKKVQLAKAMEVQVIKKYTDVFMDEGYLKTFLLISVKCKNNTDNKISGFGVDIFFSNKNGELIYSASWPVDKSINPLSTITIPLSTGEYKNTNEDQSKLKMADLSKLTVVTNVTYLTYDDGTSIRL